MIIYYSPASGRHKQILNTQSKKNIT